MGTRRDERAEQYRSDSAVDMLSPDLFCAAHNALRNSLDERRGEVMRNATTHASVNALGAVILYTTALDAALTEIITWGHLFDRAQREHALKSMAKKYNLLVAGGEPDAFLLEELGCLSDLRDEIIHYLPRSTRSAGNVPAWLKRLDERGFFIVTGRNSDFSLSQKLGSYALGHWAASTADAIVQRILKTAAPDSRFLIEGIAHNAGLYVDICAPDQLAAHDTEHGLPLTPTEPP